MPSNALSCASLAAETGSAGASIGFKPSSFPGIIALVWFDGLVVPGLTSGVAGVAGLGGTVPGTGAGAETAAGVVTDADAAGAGCGSTCGAGAAAGAAFVSLVVGVAAGWVSVDSGVAGAFSAGGGVAGAGAAAAAGELSGSDATGGAGVEAAVFVAGTAFVSGVVATAAVSAGAAGGVAACASWFEGASISTSFWSNAARAAAWVGVSFARAGMKLAKKAIAQTVDSNLKICMVVFYAKFPPDATAFPSVENNFCHAPGMG